jgi:hypothetical protein
MEKIEPLADHRRLRRFARGDDISFAGKRCTVVARTTLASGEPALLLEANGDQFVVGASRLLADEQSGEGKSK